MKTAHISRSFKELLDGIETLETTGDLSCEITSIAYDSRQAEPGALFVALPGTRADGSAYIDDAARRGAVAVVTQTPCTLGSGFPGVQVADARSALARIAAVFYGNPAESLHTVGITGTNGKTTVSFMLRDIFKAAGRCPGLIGTVRYEIGNRVLPASRTTPEAPDVQSMLFNMQRSGCNSTIMEISSHALDQHRVDGIPFDVGVFTNLTQDHLDYHGTLEEYFCVKARLFLQVTGIAVVNLDDPCGRRLIEEDWIQSDLVSYGFSEGADVRGLNPQSGNRGSSMVVESPWGSVKISLRLIGRFNLCNALATFAAAASAGIPVETIRDALAAIERVPGRLECVGNKRKHIYVDYAHTDDALRNVLKALRPITAGRLIVVFGCGGNRDSGKRRLMGEVAARLADYAILTNDNPRREPPEKIVEEIAAGFDSERKYEISLDRTAAIARGMELTGKKDVLLVAGKGHETVQEIDGAIFPFDDCETVKGLL